MYLKMKNVTYRRARNRDSEVIKNILKDTFEEYEINLPSDYSFSDIENLEEEYLNLSGEFIVLIWICSPTYPHSHLSGNACGAT